MLQEKISDFSNSLPSKKLEKPSAVSASDAFDCCSRYRECSQAKECLVQNLEYSKGCTYRSRLESGLIYYGKNAGGFSGTTYAEYLRKADALSDNSGDLLHQLLFYFFDACYCAASVCVYDSAALQELQASGFIFLGSCREFVLRNYKNEALEREINQIGSLAERWEVDKSNARNLCKDSGKPFTLRDFLIPWIRKNAAGVIDAAADQYRIVSIPASGRQYAIELYESRLRGLKPTGRLALPTDQESSFFAAPKKQAANT